MGVEWLPLIAAILVAIITGAFGLMARNSAMRNPGAASYDQMWTRMEKQDRKISTLEANFRVVGNGFDALSNAITREGSMLNFRPAEQAAVDRARLLRSGEDDPTS